jgi:hypothetical protein
MVFVAAGNHKQFQDFVRETGLTARYVSSLDQLYGLRGATLLVVGTWQNNPAYFTEHGNLVTVARMQRIRVLGEF